MIYFFLNGLMRLTLCIFILLLSSFSAQEEKHLLKGEDDIHLALKKSQPLLSLEALNLEIKEKEQQLQFLRKQQIGFFAHQTQATHQDKPNVPVRQTPALNGDGEGALSLDDLTRAYQHMAAQLQIQLSQNEMLTQALADISSLRDDIHSIKHQSSQRVHHPSAPTMLPFILKNFVPMTGAFVLSTAAFYKTYGTVTWVIKFAPMIIAPPLWAPLGISLTVAGITYTGTIIGFKIL